MATKKDLIEAQGFSRRRLLSAFVGGAPGGKELDPAKPLRAVIAGIALTAMVIVGGLFYGFLKPGLSDDWQNNRVIIATDTGARYVSVDGTLYPVINATSARLLIPAGEYAVITTTQSELADIPIGPSVGILGAPDKLPAPDALLNTGWTACIDHGEGSAVSISTQPIASPASGSGAVVTRGDDIFVIFDGLRYQVSAAHTDAVLRAVGLATADPIEVDGRWLNLYEPGEDLAPLVLDDIGSDVPGTDLSAGTIVRVGSEDSTAYILLSDGQLSPMSDIAHQMYLLGSGASAGPEQQVTPAEIAQLGTAPAAGGDDWPQQTLTPLASGMTPCAVIGDEARTVLGVTDAELPDDRSAPAMTVGTGALVRVGDSDGTGGLDMLIDASGTAFAIPEEGDDLIARLGYSEDDLGAASNAWMQFFASGPALQVSAAGLAPSDGEDG
ncbi:MAG: type VII secretion protein EccB [Microbacterium sp.]|uniref:type VII secretion protein EccB n=1 Tax=Microbacterium sp. TaxID=51671 RepID=UPI003F953FB5